MWLRSQKESVQWQETCEQGQVGPGGTKLRGQEEQTRQLQGRRRRGSAWGGMSGVEGFWWVPPEGRRQDLLMTGPGVEEDRGVDQDPQGRDLSLWAARDVS